MPTFPFSSIRSLSVFDVPVRIAKVPPPIPKDINCTRLSAEPFQPLIVKPVPAAEPD